MFDISVLSTFTILSTSQEILFYDNMHRLEESYVK
jgi:hypothetical protein